MPKFIDLTGQMFNRWTVLERAPDKAHGVGRWLCRCKCGSERAVYASLLKNSGSRSCGCHKAEVLAAGRHGHTKRGWKSRTYLAWGGLIGRCTNPRNPKYPRYGARGITVCERWRSDFVNFLADMGECPPALTIDRINNDGNYEPGNCRWATRKEQQNNRSACHYLTLNGETLTVTEWTVRLGICHNTILDRIEKDWPIERVLSSRRFNGTNARVGRRALTVGGETKSMSEWGRDTGLGLQTISNRINRRGWSAERAVTEPLHVEKIRPDRF